MIKRFLHFLAFAVELAMSGFVWCLSLFLLGAGFVVRGVYLLHGTPFAYITAGAFFIIAGLIIAKGLNNA